MSDVTVIIIALKYQREYHMLPGIMVDLCNMYKLALSINAKHIHVITDMTQNERLRVIRDAFMSGSVDSTIRVLIDKLVERGVVDFFKRDSDEEWLIDMLKYYLNNNTDRYILFYFTGHGTDDKLLLLNGRSLSYTRLREFWSNYSNRQIIQMYDCCSGVDLKLPYSYSIENDGWNLKQSEFEIYTSQIWLLTASQVGYKANSTSIGSSFTNCITKYLRDAKCLSLKSLMTNLQKEIEKCTIQSNQVRQMHLPHWLFGLKVEIKEAKEEQQLFITW